MTTRLKLLLITLAIVCSFAAGNYAGKILTKTESIQTSDKTDTTTTTKTTTTTTKQPDGKETTTTTTDTTTAIKERNTTNIKKEEIVAPSKRFINVSLLGSYNQKDKSPMYGVSITSRFLGPFTAGAFAFENGMIGLSIGVDF